MTPMKKVLPSERMKACRAAIISAIREEASDMDASEILAVAAYTVGQLIALQDQRKMTPAMAMDLVARNIEAGNLDAQTEVNSASGAAQ